MSSVTAPRSPRLLGSDGNDWGMQETLCPALTWLVEVLESGSVAQERSLQTPLGVQPSHRAGLVGCLEILFGRNPFLQKKRFKKLVSTPGFGADFTEAQNSSTFCFKFQFVEEELSAETKNQNGSGEKKKNNNKK